MHVYPYEWWMPEEWLGIWGLAGFGIGTAESTDGGGSVGEISAPGSAPSGAQLLAGSAFSAGGARWGVWGSGNLSGFGGVAGDLRQDGTVLSGYLGADYRFVPNALAGLAGSYGMLDLTSTTAVEDAGTLQVRLVHVYPYGWWMPEEWLAIWGLAGFGIGTAELTDSAGTLQGDIRTWLGAAGQRAELWSGGGVSLAAIADGFVTGVGSAGELPDVQAHAWRARLMVEAGVDARLQDARLSGLLNLGTRLDGGDAGQGLGAEAGAEISVTHVATGLRLTGRGPAAAGARGCGHPRLGRKRDTELGAAGSRSRTGRVAGTVCGDRIRPCRHESPEGRCNPAGPRPRGPPRTGAGGLRSADCCRRQRARLSARLPRHPGVLKMRNATSSTTGDGP